RCAAANPKATRAPADAICANVARHPNVPPIQAPAGTPNAIAPLTPNATAATARPVRSGGASLAAVANRAGVAVAAARAATIRKAIRTGNAGLTAAPALAAVKTSAAETRTVLRGARVIATAASGAVTATVTEKTVTRCPAVAPLTSGERAISAAPRRSRSRQCRRRGLPPRGRATSGHRHPGKPGPDDHQRRALWNVPIAAPKPFSETVGGASRRRRPTRGRGVR